MKGLKKVIGVGAGLGAGIVGAAYACYRMVFLVPKDSSDPYKGIDEKFDTYKHNIRELIDDVVKLPYEDVYIVSEDGLRLHGKYYANEPGAPVEILCHGYRGTGYRDFCGGLQHALKRGHNALLIDQRAHGESEGKCLTFGIMERKDCLSWVNYINERCGEDTKIILMGISMGAATVMMATELELPENVVAVIADCGYTSPEKIIRKVMKDIKVPQFIYPLVVLGAKIFGRFDLGESSSEKALQNSKVPVLFIHGEADDFVPCDMSKVNHEACGSKKKIVTVPGAGHALSYLVDMDAYAAAVDEFLDEV